jgi:hypothetical protein
MAMRLAGAGLAAFVLLMPLHSGALAQSAPAPQARVPIDQAPKPAPNLKRSDDANDDDDQSSGSGAQIDSAGQGTNQACSKECTGRPSGCYIMCVRSRR